MQQGFQQTMSQLPPVTLQTLEAMGLSGAVINQMAVQGFGDIANALNGMGQKIVDALDTDTRNMFAGAIMVSQPVFMGGAIIAANKMADINTEMAKNTTDVRRQSTLYQIDQAYWQVVSLHHKKQLAESYLELVKKFDSDVHKMIDEGVATRSDGLSVDVKVNEAEMTLTKVNDGLVLSRMLLNQLCGLPLNEPVTLVDEQSENIAVVELAPQLDVEKAVAYRPELKLLQNVVDLSKQSTNVLKAGNLPQVLLTGGYAVSNPNLYNGFQRKFSGVWNVGVMVRVPIWNWGDVMYKVRASKGATAIANLELAEAREMIELQVNQVTFKVDEANKKLTMAQKNIQHADENLRTANLGFQEGVISPTVVMEAQTAWMKAQSQKIDAEIEVKLSQVDLQKALGTLE
jgi:outer membrane protein TolC